jgi:hypothetical protein
MTVSGIDQRNAIASALSDFQSRVLPEASRAFFAALGYKSERRLGIDTPRQFIADLDKEGVLTGREKETLLGLSSLHFLFQLTDQELGVQPDLFRDPSAVETTHIESYLFFAAELPEATPTRGVISAIARAINKPLAMPAVVLLRHGDSVSLAMIHRRLHKRDPGRDVLEKATFVKDIRLADPIRAHLDILNDFVRQNLDAEYGIHSFVTLHNAWQKRLGAFPLNENFYREVADWFFWAQHLIGEGKIVPPKDVDTEAERSLFLIRLLTRLVFCWFLIEKRLMPSDLFRVERLGKLLKDLDGKSPSFYRAILQNLFFATLNQPLKDDDGKPCRGFRKRRSSGGRDPNRGATNLWRYEDAFRDPAMWEEAVRDIPFLNGGLFDCLDRVYQTAEGKPNVRLDGFSDNPRESAQVPNDLFFGPERTVDLSGDYGESDVRNARSRKAKVRGLIDILSRYKFTIEENTPLDQEIALDPELLGKVFENLLAAFNPETRDTARKQTGSFYTPREVVSFMVDEALIAYLEPILGGPACAVSAGRSDPAARLRHLVSTRVEDFASPFSEEETDRLVAALDGIKILDPACGSGAYPMGALHRLVDLLTKLDPDNARWVAHQRTRLKEDRSRAEAIADAEPRRQALAEVAHREREIEPVLTAGRFDRNYVRKLFLIENAIFGADIQPIAVQIAKLRFFIALICDQVTDPKAENQGILPLPNLETRLVAANTLMPIPKAEAQSELFGQKLERLRNELRDVRHEHFAARTPATKRKCRESDARLRADVAELLKRETHLPRAVAAHLAAWDPYDQNSHAPFFDPAWMFGASYLRPASLPDHPSATEDSQSQGFDIVLGNPPYVRQEKIKDQKDALKPHYPDTFTGTADLYVYFYDRALQLLRPGGVLSYITSNKWYRAAYGEKLRTHLGKTTSLLHAIDFGDAPVFTAISYPTIVIARKTPPPAKHGFRALNWDPDTPNTEIANFAVFYETRATRIAQDSLSPDGWRFMAKRGQDLLEKIRAAGTPLGKFVEGRFYYGIKTGLNEAFVVDRETRDRLIAEDSKSKELLKPFLRGRHVKRWRIEHADWWLILIESSENKHHPWSDKKDAQAEQVFRETYPAICRHFKPFREKLIDRSDQGRFFWELRSCAYYSEFASPKVMIPCIEQDVAFAVDRAGYYSNDKTSIIATDDPESLCAVLNSPLHWWFAQEHYPTKQGGYVEFKPTFMAEFPIPKLDQVESLKSLARILTVAYAGGASHPRDLQMREYYEELLNALVYELYLPDDLHAAGLRFFDLIEAAKVPNVDAMPPAPARRADAGGKPDKVLSLLREEYEELAAPTHPLRAALQKLHILEPIRIIEGKP